LVNRLKNRVRFPDTGIAFSVSKEFIKISGMMRNNQPALHN
jgi:hypothetical protein